MAYQVLARKWRPQKFSEVVGQEHIARTLRNAIINNRIGHAYLFVGSRGIGKTTSARIFAKALNCQHPVEGEPCCECDNCREIAAGSSMDVIEIDGATHNGVDNMRDLREQAQYVPSKSRYKIYIIDEVHMLSTGAWNALLKTLEEPPEHVKFLFATTEVHKVLPTIISRCQRFDLRRIPVPLIAGRLRQIADAEHLFVDDAALAAIARAADGGMRDAQSIFDQMIAFCGGMNAAETISEQDVINVFGLASGTDLREITIGIFANQLNRALDVVSALADAGRDLTRVFEDLVGYIRNLMLAATCANAQKFLEVSIEEYNDLMQLAQKIDRRIIQRVLSALIAQQRLFREAMNKRIALEVILAQIVTDAHSVALDDILTHLNVMSGLLPKENLQTLSCQSALRLAASVPPPQPAQPTVNVPPVEQVTATAPTADIAVPSPIPAAPIPASTPVVSETETETETVSAPPMAEPVPVSVPESMPVTEDVSACGVVSEGDSGIVNDTVCSEDSEEQSESASVVEDDAKARLDAFFAAQSKGQEAAVTVQESLETEAKQVTRKLPYRKATPEEFKELSKLDAVVTIAEKFHCEPFDIRIKEP